MSLLRFFRAVLALVLLMALPTFAQNRYVDDAYLPFANTAAAENRIIPQPRELQRLFRGFTLREATPVYFSFDSYAVIRALEGLQATSRHRLGFSLQPQLGGTIPEQGILLGTVHDDWMQAQLQALNVEPVTTPEGYVLHISPEGIVIAGADEQGIFYGVQSLRQLLSHDPQLPGLSIRDYPALPWRVAMVYLDAYSDSINPRLLPILAEHKFNALLVMSNYIRWDSAPGLHVPGAASKEAAQRLVEIARENLLEPIPLLETLGHVQWMFQNNQNRDLLPDPNVSVPFAYDPLNPRVYEVLFPILDEVIALFTPRYVHIGHDEVRNVNPFPGNEAGRAVGFPRLFLDHTLLLHGYLQERGIGTMMWQDVLLSGDVSQVLDEFPRDIVVTSWNYIPAAQYPSLRQLQDAGFAAMGASWHRPENILSYARYAAAQQARGMIQTRWTGYFGNNTMLAGQFEQVHAYLSAANAFWNPEAGPLYDAPTRFRQAWFGQAGSGTEVRSGVLIDLSPYGNRSIDARSASDPSRGWLGQGENTDLSALLETDRFAGVRFHLDQAISLRGEHRRVADDPQRQRIAIGRPARELAFLHTSGWSVAGTGTEIGRYTVHYQDGSHSVIPMLYSSNVLAWTDTEVRALGLEQVWRGQTRGGLDAAVSLLRWQNPRPDVPIEAIEFSTQGLIANPILLGLTLLD